MSVAGAAPGPIPESWKRLALEPPRAHGAPLGRARLRTVPEDFLVDEDLGFAPEGAGPHLLLQVRKRGANTEWVARELARRARVRPFDVGFAGLKDRHAVTTQWFSVPAGRDALGEPAHWRGQSGEGFEVLEAVAHRRKLPRGALAGNRFRLRLREAHADAEALSARVARIVEQGVPNYFGPQRFGRELSNLRGVWNAAGADGAADGRGFVLSAARSLAFNAVLAERVTDGSWCRLLQGELVNLDGSRSVFPVASAAEPDARQSLETRLAMLDVHPTGPLIGVAGLEPEATAFALEERVLAGFPEARALVAAVAMQRERRALRVAVRDLEARVVGADVELGFRLVAGAFATAVVREFVDVTEDGGGQDDRD